MPFAELLACSAFSFLRGASKPEEVVETSAELALRAVALCDRDGIYGVVRAHVRARELGQALIVGAELVLAPAHVNVARFSDQELSRKKARHCSDAAMTVALLVKNAEGYENLCNLLTLAHSGLPKGECVLELSQLARHRAGLQALIPVPPVARYPVAECQSKEWFGADFEHDDETLGAISELFGQSAAVVAYRRLDGFDPCRMEWATRVSSRFALPVVASARPLFHQRERQVLADVMYCIRHGLTLSEAGERLQANAEARLRSGSDMLKLFRDERHWVERTVEIAEECHFNLSELKYQFPCALAAGETAQEKLARLVWEGASRRYPSGVTENVKSQLVKELTVIDELQMASYFLSTWEIVEIAREKRILCQGRGSAANSAVCYVLGITAIDPARSNMLFERFMSAERAEPPDIDVDFEHERREEVIQEVYRRYGRDRAAMVSEVICYRGKSALREVGKALGLSLEQVERLSGNLSWWDEVEVTESRLAELGFDEQSELLLKVTQIARMLSGFPRHLSIHVGGFVLSAKPLSSVAPIEPGRMLGRSVVPWDKDDLEALGFFKVDVLALGMLSAVRKALQLIHYDGGLRKGSEQSDDFDPLEVITRVPDKDRAVYELACRADTVGVFQIESRAQMAMLPRLRPQCYYDLVVEVSLVRPGPIQGGMVHPYLRRRNKEEKVDYPHDSLKPILERTLGIPLFQEQVMELAISGAGYSGGEADQLRRDMAAWKKSGKLLRHRERLLSGFCKRGISQEFAERLFEQIKGFGEYGFPESHAASFALLVYVSSWLKAHYPAHFVCALLNSQPMGFYSPASLVRDAQAHGVVVREIDVRYSFWDCTLEAATTESKIESSAQGAQREVRLGLRLLKGFGRDAAQMIETQRELGKFSNLDDLVRRARLRKKQLDILAEAGALEGLVKGRRNALWKVRAPRGSGLFQNVDSNEPVVTFQSMSKAQQLVLDYAHTGLSLKDHPLCHLRAMLRQRGVITANRLGQCKQGERVQVAGLVLSRQRPGTASGVVFITLEDETGTINLVLYSKVFDQHRLVAKNSVLLCAQGKVELQLTKAQPDQVGKETAVIHVLVSALESLDLPVGDLAASSRDFH